MKPVEGRGVEGQGTNLAIKRTGSLSSPGIMYPQGRHPVSTSLCLFRLTVCLFLSVSLSMLSIISSLSIASFASAFPCHFNVPPSSFCLLMPLGFSCLFSLVSPWLLIFLVCAQAFSCLSLSGILFLFQSVSVVLFSYFVALTVL